MSDQLSVKVNRRIAERPEGWREGQAAFNALFDFNPELANTIRGDHANLDPFYRDENLPAFFKWLELVDVSSSTEDSP